MARVGSEKLALVGYVKFRFWIFGLYSIMRGLYRFSWETYPFLITPSVLITFVSRLYTCKGAAPRRAFVSSCLAELKKTPPDPRKLPM